MRSHALAVAAAVLLLSVSPSHAVTWTNANKWLDLVVPQSRFNCVTVLPIRTGYAFHRLALIPGGKDSDLYVYGYNGSWVYISASAKGGLVPDTVIFNASTGVLTTVYWLACGASAAPPNSISTTQSGIDAREPAGWRLRLAVLGLTALPPERR